MDKDTADMVRGWKQAIGIIARQQEALEFVAALIKAWGAEGRLPRNEALAEKYHHTFELARQVGADYIAAMRKSGAMEGQDGND